jgi:hypothetical protein
MPLKDLLKKKDKVEPETADQIQSHPQDLPAITFLRTTTNTQEVIAPPSYPCDQAQTDHSPNKRLSRFRRHSHTSQHADTAELREKLDTRPKSERRLSERRLSERLHLGSRSRSASSGSVNIPADLPEIQGEEGEEAWEKRATLLAKINPNTPNEGKTSGGANTVDLTGDVWCTNRD